MGEVSGRRQGYGARLWRGLWLLPVFLLACSDGPLSPGLKPGDPFPVLETFNLEGAEAQFRPATDKIVVVNFWGTWCAPCRKEMPSLQRLAEMLGSEDYEVVGIALDHDDHVVREYLLERGIHFKNYLARDIEKTQRDLGVMAVPATFVLAQNGVVARKIIGPREWDAPDSIALIRQGAHYNGANSPE